MDYGFNMQEVMYIYGRLMKEIAKAEDLLAKGAIDKTSAKNETAVSRSITDKLRAAHPELGKMDRHFPNII